jgi:hypothetical protein
MAKPAWQSIVTHLKVPGANGVSWTVALELVTPGTLLKIEVDPASAAWKPDGFTSTCTADGDVDGKARGLLSPPAPLLASAAVGALIARIGGSTADMTLDIGPPPPTSPARLVFSVGRHCVFSVPTAPIGGLFLGINDSGARMAAIIGSLSVNIFEAL